MKKLLVLFIVMTALPFSLFSQYNQCRRQEFQGHIYQSPQSISYLVKKWESHIFDTKNQGSTVSPIVQKTGFNEDVTTQNQQARPWSAAAEPSTSSINTATRWYRENTRPKADYSGLVFMAYSLFCDPTMAMQYQSKIP